MRGLYAIADVASLDRAGLEPLAFVEAVLSARPAALQLRDKSARTGGKRMLELLQEIAPLCRERGVPLFANDRADLAALAACDGVHVGQHDLPAAVARMVAAGGGRRLVGISTHCDDDVDRALADRPDYIALGPVFATASKDAADPTIGLEGLARMSARIKAAGITTVAIGGIDHEKAARIGVHCDCAAVIAALLPEPEEPDRYEWIARRAAKIDAAIKGAA